MLFDAAAKFDGVRPGQHPLLYFNSCCSSEPGRFKTHSKSSTSKNIRPRTGPCILIIAETMLSHYHEELLSLKEASGVAKTRELKFRNFESQEHRASASARGCQWPRPHPAPRPRSRSASSPGREPESGPASPKQADKRAGKGKK